MLVSTDLIGFYRATDHFREAILAKFKLQPCELFLSAIHTHSAPTPVVDKGKGHKNNRDYTKTLETKLIKARDYEELDRYILCHLMGVKY